jgi:hypothetical protein
MTEHRAADPATGEIVSPELLPALSAGARLTPAQASEWAGWLRSVTKAALVEGIDYGQIPGVDRPSLWQPGAEMLLRAAQLGFTNERLDDDDSRARRGVTYRCTVRRGDIIVATCDGYCGYDEAKYFRSAEDSERIERARAKQDRRPPREDRFGEYRAPWNTLLKMSQKRALVGAVRAALAASGLFADADADDDTPAGPSRPRGSGDRVPAHVYDDEPESRGFRS